MQRMRERERSSSHGEGSSGVGGEDGGHDGVMVDGSGALVDGSRADGGPCRARRRGLLSAGMRGSGLCSWLLPGYGDGRLMRRGCTRQSKGISGVLPGGWIASDRKGTRKLLDGLCLSWVARPCEERAIASKGRLVLPLPVSMRSAREGEE